MHNTDFLIIYLNKKHNLVILQHFFHESKNVKLKEHVITQNVVGFPVEVVGLKPKRWLRI